MRHLFCIATVNDNDNDEKPCCMKLTEQNLALAASSAANSKTTAISAEGSPLRIFNNNNDNDDAGAIKMMEVSSNLSRSSSESGAGCGGGYLKNNAVNVQQYKGNKNGGGSGGSSNNNLSTITTTTSSSVNFQPFGEDVSSLGSLKEEDDALLLLSAEEVIGAGTDTEVGAAGVGASMQKTPRDLSYMALNVHPTLSSETPPKDNLSSSSNNSSTINNNKNKKINHIPPSSPPPLPQLYCPGPLTLPPQLPRGLARRTIDTTPSAQPTQWGWR